MAASRVYLPADLLAKYDIFDKSHKSIDKADYNKAKKEYLEDVKLSAETKTYNESIDVRKSLIDSQSKETEKEILSLVKEYKDKKEDFNENLLGLSVNELIDACKELEGLLRAINDKEAQQRESESRKTFLSKKEFKGDIKKKEKAFLESKRIYMDIVSKNSIGKTLNPRVTNLNKVKSKFGYYYNSSGDYVKRNGVVLDASKGEIVRAPFSGKVLSHAYSPDYGKYITVKVSQEIRYIITHLEEIKVGKSANIKQGDIIGIAGSTGRKAGTPQVYFGLYFYGVAVDPERILKIR